MKRLILSALILGILLLAIGGWTVQGIRWTITGSRYPRRRRLAGPALGVTRVAPRAGRA